MQDARISLYPIFFIGGGAIILPGVTIGDDALIGAGSVVTRDVPAGVTAVGNPARACDPKRSKPAVGMVRDIRNQILSRRVGVRAAKRKSPS